MKLSTQCCSLDQAKKLKELGISQDSHFSWCGDESVINEDIKTMSHPKWVFIKQTEPVNLQDEDNRTDLGITIPIAATYTVAELGVMLPTENVYWATHIRPATIGTYCHAVYNHAPFGAYDTEASARAELLIYLLENNLLTSAEVNQRLQNA